MKILNLTLSVLLLGSQAWAADPVQTLASSVLQCPATNDNVKAFRKKLVALKAAIKSDANCAPIKADVNHLGDLLTTKRPEFVDLIAQGQIEGLTSDQQDQVKTYVDDLTTTTYNVLAVVTGNDACFESDKQGGSMKFLSSLLGEGAKLLSVVGGPELGPIIGVAGEAVTGFMDAMQTIASEHIGYDFSNDDQQIAYADSLCALYETRQELNTIVDSAESVQRLLALKSSIEKQLSATIAKCPECADIQNMVNAQISRAVAGEGSVVATEQVWPADFEAQVAAKAKQIDAEYTNPIGTTVYRELKTLSWIPIRVAALNSDEFNTDITLSSVVGELDEVESFMLKDQAPQYLDSILRDAEDTLADLNQTLNQEVNVLGRNGGPQLSYLNGFTLIGGAYSSPEQFYGKLFEGLDQLRGKTADSDVRDDINGFFKDLDMKSRHLDIQLDVLDKYCGFFKQAQWGWRDGISAVCNDSYVADIKQQALFLMNYRVLMESGADTNVSALQVPPVQPLPRADNWADSLRQSLDAQASDAHYVQRKL